MSPFGTPISKFFVDDITIVTTTYNEDGGKTYTSQQTVKGRIIEHHEVFTNDRNEQKDTDAVAHLPAETSGIAVDSLLYHAGHTYRVERFIRAKKGKSTAIEFLKCYLTKGEELPGIS